MNLILGLIIGLLLGASIGFLAAKSRSGKSDPVVNELNRQLQEERNKTEATIKLNVE